MASQGPGAGLPRIGPLYVKMTTPRSDGAATLKGARDIFGELSLTSQFKVAMHLSNSIGSDDKLMSWFGQAGLTLDTAQNTYYDFFCSEVVIPGATFDVAEESGSRQGAIERMPTKRVFPPVSMTFYVDNDYKLIRLFEEWMNFINPLYGSTGGGPGGSYTQTTRGQGNAKNRNDFFRMRYPDEYKRIISIVKFERNFKVNPESSGGQLGNVPSITYRLIDAFPTNITAMPLSYEGSTITKTTVEFAYTRYVYEHNRGTLPGA